MKNLKGFKEFSPEDHLNEIYDGEFSYERERSNKIAQGLENIRRRIRRDLEYQKWGKSSKDYDALQSPSWLIKNVFAGIAGLAAGAADVIGSKAKRGDKKDKEQKKEVVSPWSEDLGSSEVGKELMDFIRKSEMEAAKKFGKGWDYKNPKGSEQKRFAEMIKKKEEEIIKKMKK